MQKGCLFFLLLLFFGQGYGQVNETEAKAAFILAEEYFAKANYPLALTFLKNGKTSLGKANAKFLYLQIQIENELAKTQKNYKDSLVKTITAFQSSPDIKNFNEEQVLQVVKLKLTLALNAAQESAQLEAEEVRDEQNFNNYAFASAIKLGITVSEAEKLYPDFFRGAKREPSTDYPGLEMISSKPVNKYIGLTTTSSVFVKGDIIVGNRTLDAYPQSTWRRINYANFKKFMMNERITNTSLFGFEPITLTSGDGIGFVWKKNKRTIVRNWKDVVKKGDGFYGDLVTDIVDESY